MGRGGEWMRDAAASRWAIGRFVAKALGGGGRGEGGGGGMPRCPNTTCRSATVRGQKLVMLEIRIARGLGSCISEFKGNSKGNLQCEPRCLDETGGVRGDHASGGVRLVGILSKGVWG